MTYVPKRRLRSLPNAAAELGISRATLYRLHNAGELPFVKISGRTFVEAADLEILIDRHKQHSGSR